VALALLANLEDLVGLQLILLGGLKDQEDPEAPEDQPSLLRSSQEVLEAPEDPLDLVVLECESQS
jgi:hypothetical protein